MEVERRFEERWKQQLRRAVKEREWRDDMRGEVRFRRHDERSYNAH